MRKWQQILNMSLYFIVLKNSLFADKITSSATQLPPFIPHNNQHHKILMFSIHPQSNDSFVGIFASDTRFRAKRKLRVTESRYTQNKINQRSWTHQWHHRRTSLEVVIVVFFSLNSVSLKKKLFIQQNICVKEVRKNLMFKFFFLEHILF
jgi:hypothetical protein